MRYYKRITGTMAIAMAFAASSCTGDANRQPPTNIVTPVQDCVDEDGDSLGEGCVGGQDCDDTNPWVGEECDPCVDRDGDGHFAIKDERLGNAICHSGDDCDDDDINNWQSCDTCVDSNGDGVFIGCDDYLTIIGPDCDEPGEHEAHYIEVWWDGDGDGYGDASLMEYPQEFCIIDELPQFRADNALDCDDNDPLRNPSVSDDDSDTIDSNCDGIYGDALSGDNDRDLYAAYGTSNSMIDCDDNNFMAHPGLVDIPGDGVDNDCVDGDVTPSDTNGIFVSAQSGNDTSIGTSSTPVRSISRGVTLAEERGLDYVYVAYGDYHEAITSSVSIVGGYDPSTWQHNTSGYSTSITAEGGDFAIKITGGANVLLSDLRITMSNSSNAIVGVFISSASSVLINVLLDVVSPSESMMRDVAIGIDAVNSHLLLLSSVISVACNAEDMVAIRVNDIREYGSFADRSSTTVVNSILNVGLGTDTNYGDALTSVSGGNIAAGIYVEEYESQTVYVVNSIIDIDSLAMSSVPLIVHSPSLILNTLLISGTSTELSGLRMSDAFIANNIIEVGYSINSDTVASGSAFLSGDNEILYIYNNIIWSPNPFSVFDPLILSPISNETDINSCTWVGCRGSGGNIISDPVIAQDDYHLESSSPGVDAGISVAGLFDSYARFMANAGSRNRSLPVYAGAFWDLDIDGDPRPQGAGWDIGADEYVP